MAWLVVRDGGKEVGVWNKVENYLRMAVSLG